MGVKPGSCLASPDADAPRAALNVSPAAQTEGHLLDTGGLNLALDLVTEAGESFRVTDISLAERKDQPSHAEFYFVAPSGERLQAVVHELMQIGARPAALTGEARVRTSERAPSRPRADLAGVDSDSADSLG